MQEKIKNLIQDALRSLDFTEEVDFVVEHPEDLQNGDYSTNVAMVCAKKLKINPRDLAEKIVASLLHLTKGEARRGYIGKIEVAGAGFINFYLSREFFADSVKEILEQNENWGKNDSLVGRKVMVEFTDPNPFKEFHIGHLMSNTIGESISRVIEYSGAEIKRACYQGDVGLHVAKAVWAMMKKNPPIGTGIVYDPRSAFELGQAYSEGDMAYNNNELSRKEISLINKKIYAIDQNKEYAIFTEEGWYKRGRELSLNYFDEMYKKLGTKFDFYFFESAIGAFGKEIVEKNIGSVFERSEGAVIFKGENFDKTLHTRVFITKENLPVYEAKELGLTKIKYDSYPYDISIVVTGNEIKEYFRVLLKAMSFVFPDLATKTKHIPHGMLRLPSGKMSSRTGNIVTAKFLIDQVGDKVLEKIKGREFSEAERNAVAEIVAIGAIKYSILRQAVGGDIIFDFAKSVSFEGDSGPYLQYSAIRAKSVLAKVLNEKIPNLEALPPSEVNSLEKILYRFPEIVLRAYQDLEPHHIATYLTELASSFNSFYAQTQIINSKDKFSPYYLAVTQAFFTTMQNGLNLLGIKVPEKM